MTNSKNTSFTELKHFIGLVLTKVHLNLKSEASKSYLSYLWWILEPALFVSVYYLVFGIFLASRTNDFIVFLVCGQIPFLWFARTVNNSANSIVSGKGLMNQIAIQKAFFPLVVILQDIVKSLAVFLLMLFFLWLMDFPPQKSWLSLPLIMLTQAVFITLVSLIGAAIVPFVPDLKYIISTGVMMMMFGSGIFYDYKVAILPEHRELFLSNPMASLIRLYREVLMDGVWPEWSVLFHILSISIVCIVIVLSVYRNIGSKFPRLVLQ